MLISQAGARRTDTILMRLPEEKHMSDDRVVGLVKEGVGRVQDAAGGLVGDNETQAKGKLNEVAGSVQNAYGQMKDQAQDALDQATEKARDTYGSLESFVREQPLPALAIGVGVGFLLGVLLKSGGRSS
jgi:uncharacterized protein YjbJ (UPF0337 family)